MEGSRAGRDPAFSQFHSVIIGGVYPDSGNNFRTACSLVTYEAGIYAIPANNNNDYKNFAFASLESIFRPYSVLPANSGLAHFVDPSNNAQRPTVNDLNPWGSGVGQIDIRYATNGLTAPKNKTIDTGATDYDAPSVRGMALKGPLIIAGPGYDINGKPVPNAATDGSSDNFVGNYRKRPDLHPCGPLDARWDKDRGVWVAGTPPVLAMILQHSGQVATRPGYICRICTGIDSSLGFQFPTGEAFGSGTNDKHVFNIQDAVGTTWTIGVGQVVELKSVFGQTYMNENSRSLLFN